MPRRKSPSEGLRWPTFITAARGQDANRPGLIDVMGRGEGPLLRLKSVCGEGRTASVSIQ